MTATNRKLLIVDDNEDVQKLHQVAFRQAGFDIVTKTSGAEALLYLSKTDVYAVILDLAMPVMDGLSCAEEIRMNEKMNHRKPVRLAFYTAKQIDAPIKNVGRRTFVERYFKCGQDIENFIDEVARWFKSETIHDILKGNIPPEKDDFSLWRL